MSMKDPAEMSDDELEAAQRAVDGEEDGTAQEGGTEEESEEQSITEETTEQQQEGTTASGETSEEADPATTTEQQQGTEAAAQTSAGAEEQPAKPAGVASKDGSRVLPYAALQAERRSARAASARAERAERENAALKKEIEDLRAGRSKDQGTLTEEEVQRMETEFPEEGKKLRAAFERTKELEKQVAASKPKEPTEQEIGDDPVQEAIDQVPLLVEWQHDPQHADKWQRSIELDNALQNSPKWKGKPAVDRFAHVAKLVADEFDIEVPQEKTPPAPKQASSEKTAAKQSDPKQVAAKAERQPPSTLTDLKGGSVPEHGQTDFKRMGPQQMLGKFMDMSDDEIDRQLAGLG